MIKLKKIYMMYITIKTITQIWFERYLVSSFQGSVVCLSVRMSQPLFSETIITILLKLGMQMYSVNRIKILHKNKKNWGFPILRTETQKFFSHQTHTCGVSMDRSLKMVLRFLISFFSKLNSLRERHFQTFWRFQ